MKKLIIVTMGFLALASQNSFAKKEVLKDRSLECELRIFRLRGPESMNVDIRDTKVLKIKSEEFVQEKGEFINFWKEIEKSYIDPIDRQRKVITISASIYKNGSGSNLNRLTLLASPTDMPGRNDARFTISTESTDGESANINYKESASGASNGLELDARCTLE